MNHKLEKMHKMSGMAPLNMNYYLIKQQLALGELYIILI